MTTARSSDSAEPIDPDSFPDFEQFLVELSDTARGSTDVLGLVAFGSTADRRRADEWSDHDFAWITGPGAEDRYRLDLTWLPAHESIALAIVEHHGGVKAAYDNGHRVEFGIAEPDAFATWAGGPAEVLVGDESVHAATAEVVARRPEGDVDAAREVGLMLTQLHSGIGRARRGELLSASGLVRFEAINHLARAVVARLGDHAKQLDPLDPRRRFEAVFQDLGVRLERAVRLPVEDAAREILAIAVEHLKPGWPDFPDRGLAAVRQVLG